MAAGGGHWMKSPFTSTFGNAVFMPADITKTGEDSYALGKYDLKLMANGQWELNHDGDFISNFVHEHSGLVTMAGLQATGLKKYSDIDDAVVDVFDVTVNGNVVAKYSPILDSWNANHTQVYSAFLSYLKDMAGNPMATPLGQSLGLGKPAATPPSGGLFED